MQEDILMVAYMNKLDMQLDVILKFCWILRCSNAKSYNTIGSIQDSMLLFEENDVKLSVGK